MNQSISIQKPLNRKMVSFVYKMMDFNLTREPLSENILIEMGVDQNRVMTSCDSAFAADYSVKTGQIEMMVQKNNLKHGGIGLAIRGDREVDYDRLIDTINIIHQKYHQKVYFISTCKAHDMAIYKNLLKNCEIFFLYDANDYKLLAQLIQYLDLVITDRYHVVIFSIIASVPVLGLKAQSIKMDGLFQLMEYPFSLQSFETLSKIELVKQIDQIFERKNEIKQLLTKTYLALKEKALNDLKRIPNDILDMS